MTLKETIQKEKRIYNGSRCGVAELLDRIPKPDRAALEVAMADSNVQHSQLMRAVKKEYEDQGWVLSRTSVTRHRRGECSCGK